MAFLKVDLPALAATLGVDLEPAIAALKVFYAEVDLANARNTQTLNLPCHRGCDACCHESVFLTPLEFFAVWDYVQQQLSDDVREAIITAGLDLYARNAPLIRKLDEPSNDGHLAVARELRFRCPLLGPAGACLVYPVRELYARLFGCSFNEAGGVYGCHLVGAHLGGREVTMLRVESVAQRLTQLPLTFKRQVYPYYIHLLYG